MINSSPALSASPMFHKGVDKGEDAVVNGDNAGNLRIDE
jgi:hypothetical protein